MSLRIVLDTPALAPPAVADLLLRAAAEGLFRPVWSARILEELRASLMAVHPGTGLAERRIAAMGRIFDDALVGEPANVAWFLPDPQDAHVAGIAVRARADLIVTDEPARFPASELAPWGVAASSVDDFLLGLLRAEPDALVRAVADQATSAHLPADELTGLLAAAGAPGFAAACDEEWGRLGPEPRRSTA